MDLNSKHLSILKKASNKTITLDGEGYAEIVNYFIHHKLIDFTISREDEKIYYHIKTNEKGKAALYEKTSVSHRANVAIVLSIIAIIISVLTAFTPFSDWSKEWIKSFIETLFLQ